MDEFSCKEDAAYFFVPMKKKTENGSRPDRSAGNGYWKATSGDKDIVGIDADGRNVVMAITRSLAYHSMDHLGTKGKAKDGKKTNWIMHEFRLKDENKVSF